VESRRGYGRKELAGAAAAQIETPGYCSARRKLERAHHRTRVLELKLLFDIQALGLQPTKSVSGIPRGDVL
jgi:hypothetical protein